MVTYPDMTSVSGDLYDIAYQWGWNTPELRSLVYSCYKTPDLIDNARRFYQSSEFQECIRILSELGKTPDKNLKVLDLGCGNGIASYALSRAGYSVIGMDSSSGEIAGINAAKKIQNLDNAMFEILHSTGERLNFSDDTFDVIWLRETLHHIKKLEGFLKELNRVLKADGIVCCLRDAVIWNESQRQHFFASHPFYPITKDEGCYYLSEYLSAFGKSGLVLEKIFDPCSSVINSAPNPLTPGIIFDEKQSKERKYGYDLFSFFVRKPKSYGSLNDAVTYLNSGKTIEALEILERLRESLPNPHIEYCRGIALARLNRISEAVDTLEALYKVSPDYPKLQELLSELKAVAKPVAHSNRNIFKYGKNFYGAVLLNPTTLANIATSAELWKKLLSFHHLLITDEYVEYMDKFYRECVKRFGENWHYMDIINVLFAASETLQPSNYLEIGVRRGRGLCTVVRGCPTVNILAFDMWISDYGGMENPGPDFVQSELNKHHHAGAIRFINGDSHKTVPEYFRQNPQAIFDMITVDGDHTEAGAFDDLCNVIPHLAVGGVLIFDGISHPSHQYLLNVWHKVLSQFPFLSGYEYTEMGYGVAFAIRRSET